MGFFIHGVVILLTLGSIKKNRKFQPDKATLLKSIPDLELSRILECPKKRKKPWKQISKSKLRGLLGPMQNTSRLSYLGLAPMTMWVIERLTLFGNL